MANKFNLKIKLDRFEIKKRSVLPKLLANKTQNFFVDAFKKQAWEGVAWKEVKRRIPGTPEYKYPKTWGLSRRTSDILVGAGRVKGKAGGALRRDVANSKREVTFERITFSLNVPYGKYHNKGTATIVPRPFMKNSKTLRAMHRQIFDDFVKGIFNTK